MRTALTKWTMIAVLLGATLGCSSGREPADADEATLQGASPTTGKPAPPSSPVARPAADQVGFEVPPQLVSMDPPHYPSIAKDAGVQGTVILRVLVNTEGMVEDVMVVQSIPMLDEAAVDAAWTAVFKPGTQDGQPVKVWMVLPMQFGL